MNMQLQNRIKAYEMGDLDANEVVELFSELISQGLIKYLDDYYVHEATALKLAGYIGENGRILSYPLND